MSNDNQVDPRVLFCNWYFLYYSIQKVSWQYSIWVILFTCSDHVQISPLFTLLSLFVCFHFHEQQRSFSEWEKTQSQLPQEYNPTAPFSTLSLQLNWQKTAVEDGVSPLTPMNVPLWNWCHSFVPPMSEELQMQHG